MNTTLVNGPAESTGSDPADFFAGKFDFTAEPISGEHVNDIKLNSRAATPPGGS